jgi:CRP-like cAMP-binding protein
LLLKFFSKEFAGKEQPQLLKSNQSLKRAVSLGQGHRKSIFAEVLSAMHESLIKYFNSYTTIPLTEDEVNSIVSVFVPKKFRKHQYFLQEGEVCEYTAFIIKGAMRQYTVDEKGEEHIIRLYIENWWATDRESFMKQTPSIYFIDAWEETECLLVTRDALTDLVIHIPALSECCQRFFYLP